MTNVEDHCRISQYSVFQKPSAKKKESFKQNLSRMEMLLLAGKVARFWLVMFVTFKPAVSLGMVSFKDYLFFSPKTVLKICYIIRLFWQEVCHLCLNGLFLLLLAFKLKTYSTEILLLLIPQSTLYDALRTSLVDSVTAVGRNWRVISLFCEDNVSFTHIPHSILELAINFPVEIML